MTTSNPFEDAARLRDLAKAYAEQADKLHDAIDSYLARGLTRLQLNNIHEDVMRAVSFASRRWDSE